MSSNAPSMPLFGDAYLADTRHLSLEEHGAYLQLMMIAWRSSDCALPDDDARIARMLGITAGRWAKLKPTVMAFWSLGENGWIQKRLTKERAFVDEKRAKNKSAAESRWNGQVVENKQSDECERISERNAPPPPPPISIEPKGSCASDDAPILKPEHVVEIWNETAPRIGKPSVRDITPERRQLLKARIGQYALEDFQSVFGKIERSAFLSGWRGCGFDWVFKKANFQKILEGNYDQ